MLYIILLNVISYGLFSSFLSRIQPIYIYKIYFREYIYIYICVCVELRCKVSTSLFFCTKY